MDKLHLCPGGDLYIFFVTQGAIWTTSPVTQTTLVETAGGPVNVNLLLLLKSINLITVKKVYEYEAQYLLIK